MKCDIIMMQCNKCNSGGKFGKQSRPRNSVLTRRAGKENGSNGWATACRLARNQSWRRQEKTALQKEVRGGTKAWRHQRHWGIEGPPGCKHYSSIGCFQMGKVEKWCWAWGISHLSIQKHVRGHLDLDSWTLSVTWRSPPMWLHGSNLYPGVSHYKAYPPFNCETKINSPTFLKMSCRTEVLKNWLDIKFFTKINKFTEFVGEVGSIYFITRTDLGCASISRVNMVPSAGYVSCDK